MFSRYPLKLFKFKEFADPQIRNSARIQKTLPETDSLKHVYLNLIVSFFPCVAALSAFLVLRYAYNLSRSLSGVYNILLKQEVLSAPGYRKSIPYISFPSFIHERWSERSALLFGPGNNRAIRFSCYQPTW